MSFASAWSHINLRIPPNLSLSASHYYYYYYYLNFRLVDTSRRLDEGNQFWSWVRISKAIHMNR